MTPYVCAFTGLLVVVFVAQIPYGESLNCYQCDSTSHSQCLEQFDHQYSSLMSTKCTVVDARYCVKVTGAWGSVTGTYRFCSSRDMGNQCQYFNFEDHDRRYRACVRTCHTDDCNSASHVRGLTTAILLSLVAMWILLRQD